LRAAAELQGPSNAITELTAGLGPSRTAERALYECLARRRLVIAAVEYRLTSAGSELEHAIPGRFTIELQP
jgi:hypothetical protein